MQPPQKLIPFDVIDAGQDWCIALNVIGISAAVAAAPSAARTIATGANHTDLTVGETRFTLAALPADIVTKVAGMPQGGTVLVVEVWPDGKKNAVSFDPHPAG